MTAFRVEEVQIGCNVSLGGERNFHLSGNLIHLYRSTSQRLFVHPWKFPAESVIHWLKALSALVSLPMDYVVLKRCVVTAFKRNLIISVVLK